MAGAAAGLQALGQLGAAALTSPPSYSAANSDSSQAGVTLTPTTAFSSAFNVAGGGARGGSLGTNSAGGVSVAGNSTVASATGTGGTLTLSKLLIPALLIGGAAWFLLKHKKSS